MELERWNMLNPEAEQKTSWVWRCLENTKGPVIAATDHMKLYADQIRPYIRRSYRVLGTDGFGRSDSRQKLRYFFEVDRYFVVVAALKALADEGTIAPRQVSEAMKKYSIDADKLYPPKH